jgi:hypothetical protein
LSTPTSWEREPTSTLLEELEWTASTVMSKWILLLSRMRIIWVFSIIVSLPQFYHRQPHLNKWGQEAYLVW